MENELNGIISGDKGILINWEWKYEGNETKDLQDTKDGVNIRQYNFMIYAIGE